MASLIIWATRKNHLCVLALTLIGCVTLDKFSMPWFLFFYKVLGDAKLNQILTNVWCRTQDDGQGSKKHYRTLNCRVKKLLLLHSLLILLIEEKVLVWYHFIFNISLILVNLLGREIAGLKARAF